MFHRSMLLSVALLSLLISGAGVQAAPGPNEVDDEAPRHPVMIRLEGMITPLTHEYMKRQLQRARDVNADFVIIDIHSPGGDAQASIDMATDLAHVDWATTVAYVDRLAMSGAAFVALGCDQIVMRPNATIGDAGPIVLGEDSLFRHAPEKIVSFLAAEIRNVAQMQGHPPALAEAMVDKSLTVYYFRNRENGETRCMSKAEVADLNDPDAWEEVKPVFGSGGGRFLTLNGKAALETGLATATVENFEAFKKRYHIKGNVPVFQQTWVDTFIWFLNIPFITVMLLVLGLIFLYIELHMPGVGIFGLLSGACFVLFFWSKFLGGTADWLEVLLFIGGVACIGVEIFLLPGFGVFGVTGALLVLAGLTMAITPNVSQFTDNFDQLLGSAATVASSLAVFVISAVVLGRYLGVLPMFRKMMLHPPADAPAVEEATEEELSSSGFASANALVGEVGRTLTPLRPAGKARLDGHTRDVVAEGSFISQDRPVRVILVQGNRIVVRETEEV